MPGARPATRFRASTTPRSPRPVHARRPPMVPRTPRCDSDSEQERDRALGGDCERQARLVAHALVERAFAGGRRREVTTVLPDRAHHPLLELESGPLRDELDDPAYLHYPAGERRLGDDERDATAGPHDASGLVDDVGEILNVAAENALGAGCEVFAGGLSDDRPIVRVDERLAVRADDGGPQLAKVGDRVAEPDEAETVTAEVVDRLKIGRRRHDDVDAAVRHRDLTRVTAVKTQAVPAGPRVGGLAVPAGDDARGDFEAIDRVEAGARPHAVRTTV